MTVPFALPDAKQHALIPGTEPPDTGTPLGSSGDPTVTFTTTLSGDVDWDFGDGNTDTTNTGGASHTYAANGTYTVTASNGIRSETVEVTIAAVP